MANRERIDLLLVKRGLAPSRTIAQALLMEGRVSVEGRRVEKPGSLVNAASAIEIAGPPRPFVSRGGVKLEAALEAFEVTVEGAVALDVGAGTGGFTDCLLKRGAAHVYALDVGHGQIDHGLRTDPRVTVIERINARFLDREQLPGLADLAVMDVSFISATMILPRIPGVLRGRDVVVLVKPQFEVGKGEVGPGGIVRGVDGWRRALLLVTTGALECHLEPVGLIPSPITGAEGNREFLLHLRTDPSIPREDGPGGSRLAPMIEAALESAERQASRELP